MSELDSEVAQNRITEIVAPLMQQIEPQNRAVFLAMAERLAGTRYRGWAKEVPNLTTVLIECAEREELIAEKIEGLHPDAAKVVAKINDEYPDLKNLQDKVFGDYGLRMQFAIQAQGERRGGARWQMFAEKEKDAAIISVYQECTDMEIANAVELEKILAQNLI